MRWWRLRNGAEITSRYGRRTGGVSLLVQPAGSRSAAADSPQHLAEFVRLPSVWLGRVKTTRAGRAILRADGTDALSEGADEPFRFLTGAARTCRPGDERRHWLRSFMLWFRMIDKVLASGSRDIPLHSALGFFRDGACDPAFREQWVEIIALECFAMFHADELLNIRAFLGTGASPKQLQKLLHDLSSNLSGSRLWPDGRSDCFKDCQPLRCEAVFLPLALSRGTSVCTGKRTMK